MHKQSKVLKAPSNDNFTLMLKTIFKTRSLVFFSYGNTTTQTSSLNQTNPKFTEVSHSDKPIHHVFEMRH